MQFTSDNTWTYTTDSDVSGTMETYTYTTSYNFSSRGAVGSCMAPGVVPPGLLLLATGTVDPKKKKRGGGKGKVRKEGCCLYTWAASFRTTFDSKIPINFNF